MEIDYDQVRGDCAMSKSFICFESGGSLFLISLEWIWHILKGPSEGQEAVEYEGVRIPAREFCSLWKSETEGTANADRF